MKDRNNMKMTLRYIPALAATFLLALACQQSELDGDMAAGEEMTVSITASIPSGIDTKAFGDASGIDVVYYELWTSDFQTRLYPATGDEPVSAEVVDGKAVIENLKLVRGDSYGILFWAQNSACKAYSFTDLKNIGIDYAAVENEGEETGNKEIRDAFYCCDILKIGHHAFGNTDFTLKRPFAQVNFGADMTRLLEENALLGAIDYKGYEIEIPVATTFRMVDGGRGVAHDDADKRTHTFTATELASTTEDLVQGYTHLAMNYIIPVGRGRQTIDINARFHVTQGGGTHTVEHNLTNIPVQANHRTNIYGNLFTADTELTVDFAEYAGNENILAH